MRRLLFALVLLLLTAWASAEPSVTTNAKLGELLKSQLSEYQGEPGRWMGVYNERPVMVLTDESHNRMRVVSPVKELKGSMALSDLELCMKANFATALDARYAIYDGMLWSVYLHPLAEFSPSLMEDVLSQVTTLAKSYGSEYSSGELQFAPEPKRNIPEPEVEVGYRPTSLLQSF